MIITFLPSEGKPIHFSHNQISHVRQIADHIREHKIKKDNLEIDISKVSLMTHTNLKRLQNIITNNYCLEDHTIEDNSIMIIIMMGFKMSSDQIFGSFCRKVIKYYGWEKLKEKCCTWKEEFFNICAEFLTISQLMEIQDDRKEYVDKYLDHVDDYFLTEKNIKQIALYINWRGIDAMRHLQKISDETLYSIFYCNQMVFQNFQLNLGTLSKLIKYKKLNEMMINLLLWSAVYHNSIYHIKMIVENCTVKYLIVGIMETIYQNNNLEITKYFVSKNLYQLPVKAPNNNTS
jgi:hypothetical protein